MSDIIFNISGGTNQILPNATKGEQHFYGDRFAEAALRQSAAGQDSDDQASDNEAERQLALYIINKERAKDYTSQLRPRNVAREVGAVVAAMVDNRDITKEQAVTQVFIDKLLPFLGNVAKGKTIDNLRTHINNALEEHKSLQRMRATYNLTKTHLRASPNAPTCISQRTYVHRPTHLCAFEYGNMEIWKDEKYENMTRLR